jgi:hypothetical protein
MKFKVVTLTILAIITMLIPTVGVFAATEFWQGSAAVTVSDPVAISLKSGDGTYNDTDHSWAVSIIGGGTKTLVLTATNGSTSAYRVYATKTPGFEGSAVTAAWTPAYADIPGGGSQEYTLTVTSTAAAPLGMYSFNLAFSK